MEKKFDPTKPVQTRDGRKVRIICTDRKFNGSPILALFDNLGQEFVAAYDSNGRSSGTLEDLVNVPEKVTLYMNVYPGEYQGEFYGRAYTTQEQATRNAAASQAAAIAVPVTIEI